MHALKTKALLRVQILVDFLGVGISALCPKVWKNITIQLREGFKKKSAEFSALFKTHPPHSQSAEKK